MTESVLCLSHPVSLITHPPFPAHALVFALRNLPLDSDQESQEARLPERGTELPAAHWHPRRWDPGLKTGAWEESRARSWGLLGSSRLLVPGGGCCQPQTSVPGTGIQWVSGPEISQLRRSRAREWEGEAEPAGSGLGARETGLSEGTLSP